MDLLPAFSGSRIGAQVLLLSGLIFLYFGLRSIYYLYFHPLARFPGDKLAAITEKYAFYHDMVRPGQYWRVVEDMHRRHGPIVRVRPDVLSCSDPEFIDAIYTQSPKQRRERYRTVTDAMSAPRSTLATKDHDLHRKRRAVLNPFFSKQNVRRLEPILHTTLQTLLHRMDIWAKEGGPVKLSTPFRAATTDIIRTYAFGGGERFLEMESMNSAFFDALEPQRVCYLGTYFPQVGTTVAKLPPKAIMWLNPRVGTFAQFLIDLGQKIGSLKNDKEAPEQKTIFHELFHADLPESEKDVDRLVQESMILLVAGSETTASTMSAIMYHMLTDQKLLNRLKAELETVMPDPSQFPDASKLDALPFLNAVIEEAIRLYPGATHRQDRVAPDEDLIYHGSNGEQIVIPKGTAIGMAAPTVNRSPKIYEKPDEYTPDRYLDNPRLQRYQMSFSKGTRQCLGINLAYSELQYFTAGIFRKYDVYDPAKKEQGGPTFELYETTRDDVTLYSDYIVPGQKEGSQGLRVRIRE